MSFKFLPLMFFPNCNMYHTIFFLILIVLSLINFPNSNMYYNMFSLKLRSNDPTSHPTFHPTFNPTLAGVPTSVVKRPNI